MPPGRERSLMAFLMPDWSFHAPCVWINCQWGHDQTSVATAIVGTCLAKPANLLSSQGRSSLGCGIDVATSSVLVGTRCRLIEARGSRTGVPIIEPSGLSRAICHRSLGSKIELLASLDMVEDIDCRTVSLPPVWTSLRSQPGSDLSADMAGRDIAAPTTLVNHDAGLQCHSSAFGTDCR
jgi:hypothetical protein